MKYYETSFEDYILSTTECNLHPKLTKIYEKFPTKIEDLKNIILFGPPGTGKYSQSLFIISKYSQTSLKYEKKVNIIFNKEPYFFKISDIHYEVDFDLLGCNSKQLWYEIFMHIIDIINTKQNKSGIILCKNFHKINNELLEIFYSYMQSNYSHINIIFFILTDEMGFINDNILNKCFTLNISRPSKSQYNKILQYNNLCCSQNKISKLNQNSSSYLINNIKNIHNNEHDYILFSNNILKYINNIDNINLVQFRELMYDILIYEVNIYSLIWHILSSIISENNTMTSQKINNILIKTFEFLKYFNNNYRPIFHLENYFLFLCKMINE